MVEAFLCAATVTLYVTLAVLGLMFVAVPLTFAFFYSRMVNR